MATAKSPHHRWLMIVDSDRPALQASLVKTFGRSPAFQILLDRQQGVRQQRSGPRIPERRHAERRRPQLVGGNARFLLVPP